MRGIRNEQAEMTEVRGDTKAALTEKKHYCKKKKQLKGSLAGGALRKNATNVSSDLGSISGRCDLFMGAYYLFVFFCCCCFLKERKRAILAITSIRN